MLCGLIFSVFAASRTFLEQKILNQKLLDRRGWRFSSVVEHLPSRVATLGSIPSTQKKRVAACGMTELLWGSS
jgi:hypothetical protein